MIKALITDFDGTLVDTFEANFRAYQRAFATVKLKLTEERYRECFGFRYDRFMIEMGISDQVIANTIKEAKKRCYPEFFDCLKPNDALINMIFSFKNMGGKTAVASTARKDNLLNVINHLGILDIFSAVVAGDDVINGKPDPEIYFKTMQALDVTPNSTIIFEDSKVGVDAAKATGAFCMVVSQAQFNIFG